MHTPADIRFAVDRMLVKLGTYLRILGYDAEWRPSGRTHELIREANASGRVFVTRNRRIPQEYPRPERMLLVESTDPVRQLTEVVRGAGLDPQRFLFTACIRCNVALHTVPDKAEIRDRVHPNVYEGYGAFYRCPSCGTVFWHGSHVRNTCRKLGLPLPALSIAASEDERKMGTY